MPLSIGMIAVFGALRGYGPSLPVLYSATFLMGVGVAVTQPVFPALVREWFPRKIAIATANPPPRTHSQGFHL